jgi:tetratricopeptide (TPR) repeat protein
MTTGLEDPLRGARRAVQGARFREAWDQLSAQPDAVQRQPEWLLLAAMARWRLGEYSAARLAAVEARNLYRRGGDLDGEMRAENVAAAGSFALGDLAEAERGFLRAQSLAEGVGDEVMRARCANNLGNVAYYRCEDLAALSFYRLAQTRFDRIGMHHGVAETLINMGIVWRDMDLLKESLESAERAFELASRIGSRRLAAQALAMRGEALALLGDGPLGQAQVRHALDLARAQEDHVAEIDALRILCHLESGSNPELAERLGREAVALARSLGQPWATAEAERDLGQFYQRVGRREEAAGRFAAAAAAFESLGAATRARHMREREPGTR